MSKKLYHTLVAITAFLPLLLTLFSVFRTGTIISYNPVLGSSFIHTALASAVKIITGNNQLSPELITICNALSFSCYAELLSVLIDFTMFIPRICRKVFNYGDANL